MMNASSCQRLPTTGETVVLKNLVSSPALNGKRGQVIRYKEDLHRYVVKLRLLDDADGSEKTKTLSLKPENVSLLLIDNRETNDAASSIRGNDAFYFCGDWDIVHVLVPCHLQNKRRYKQFRECCRSLVRQIGRCRIFVGLSGPIELRQLAMDCLRFNAAISKNGLGRRHQWIVLDDDKTDEQADDESKYTKKSQFQHYKLLLAVSTMIKSNAWLMFLDNDDLYHPWRVQYFQQIILRRRRENHSSRGYCDHTFNCAGKLLIDVVKTNAKFGNDNGVIKYDQLINLSDELDGLVDVAATVRENEEKDSAEYFDMCVKTEILQKFIDMTPDGILSNQFCDVRFGSSLCHGEIQCYSHPTQQWLLMHYRIRMQDRHQQFLDLDLNTFTNATMYIEISEDDRFLEAKTGLKAAKIAFFRRDIEETAIQAVNRDDEHELFFRNRRVPNMDTAYGHSIGTLVWKQVMVKLEACYSVEQAKKSREWWLGCGVQPPTPSDQDTDADRAKYF